MKNKNRILWIGLVVLLMLVSSVSCIYDYYMDESNLKIKIPQLKDGSIDNALVVVHNKETKEFAAGIFINGSATTNTWNTAAYNSSSNVIRFKVSSGKTYQVSAFANINEGCFTSETLDQDQFAIWETSYDGTDYSTSFDDLRFLFEEVQTSTYMDDSQAIEMDLGTSLSNLYHAKITCDFKNIPQDIDHIVVRYKTSSALYTSGKYGMQGSDDQWVVYKYESVSSSATRTIEILPSPGYIYTDNGYRSDNSTPMDSSDGITDLDLEVYFYNVSGTLEAYQAPISNGASVLIENGSRRYDNQTYWSKSSPINIAPGEELTITFDGFLVTSVNLVDWEAVLGCNCANICNGGGNDDPCCGCHGLNSGNCSCGAMVDPM